jgi:hypothetical protein
MKPPSTLRIFGFCIILAHISSHYTVFPLKKFHVLILFSFTVCPIAIICDQRCTQGKNEEHNGKNIHDRFVHLPPSDRAKKKTQIGGWHIIIPQPHPYLPVPVRTGTVPESIPDAENKPGEYSQNHNRKVDLPRFCPQPAQKDKKDQ